MTARTAHHFTVPILESFLTEITQFFLYKTAFCASSGFTPCFESTPHKLRSREKGYPGTERVPYSPSLFAAQN